MKKWYVVNTYSGHENRVRTALERRAESMGLSRLFGEVRIPTESVVEVKNGKKVPTERRQFPGYILVNMQMSDEMYNLVNQTQGVTQIVGAGDRPTPLSKTEVERLLRPEEAEEKEKQPKAVVDYEIGETVRVISGPLSDFTGRVSDINVDQSKLKVMVDIFGRPTPAELSFSQVAKL